MNGQHGQYYVVPSEKRGSCIIDRNRIPYIIGCNLPNICTSQLQKAQTQMISSIVQQEQAVALLLDIYFLLDTGSCSLSICLFQQDHPSFFADLEEAQALYLLPEGTNPLIHNNPSVFMTCLNQKGIGVAITEQLRQTICVMRQTFPLPNVFIPASAPGFSL
ncbi:hypothetical protein LSG31_04070 [Fodinisporobacter ferrooxydans]|uniref:Uncharacterized protein n=1 Tax=Fodinisporobacter ferrooxydans TaxID=2901836 RepID=A0ABY4CLQ7_9BACL|nr:hypothetical protein LSG31_04070 [Alicyclobacillaceae bacterium MYW30-H2]